MLCLPAFSRPPGCWEQYPGGKEFSRKARILPGWRGWFIICCVALLHVTPAPAVILWNDPRAKLVHDNGAGSDLLGGAVKRDETANDTLYFKFHVDPLSDKDTEEYFAGFELYNGDAERLGIGNSLKAWAYSAFLRADDTIETDEANEPEGPVDLHSAKPELVTSDSYEYPRHGVGATIVFKVQYVPGEDDLVTVWLNPDLGPGANEADQPDKLTTRFNANATFDEIRLRHGGRGEAGYLATSRLQPPSAILWMPAARGQTMQPLAPSATSGLSIFNPGKKIKVSPFVRLTHWRKPAMVLSGSAVMTDWPVLTASILCLLASRKGLKAAVSASCSRILRARFGLAARMVG